MGFSITALSLYLLLSAAGVADNPATPPEPSQPLPASPDNDGAGTRENPYTVPRASSAIEIDGVIEEAAWGSALVLELAVEVWPLENEPAPVRTELLLTYDGDNFYAAFRAYDHEPSSIRARFRDHDSLGNDDWVGLVIDTFNDERNCMEFLVTALGVQCDGIGSPAGEDYSWDSIWNSAGTLNETGYAVEIAIPWSTLRFKRSDGPQVWGLDAVRRYSRDQVHHIGLFPRDRNNNCYGCQFVKIKGFEGVSPGLNIEINPTLTGIRTDERGSLPDGEFQKARQDAEIGITAQWGITPNVTFNATANPDFSQVEADSLQLDINEPFALYYEEKRPFFNEGAYIFQTFANVVYTRTMRDPNWGFKVTGREGANTFGAYVVRDDVTNLLFPGSQSSDGTSLPMESTASVFRYKWDFGTNSSLGAIATDREGNEYFNRMFGVDGNLALTMKDRLVFQFLGSSTSYPGDVAREFQQPGDDFSGGLFDLEYTHSTRNLIFLAGYQDIGRDFRADLGYMPQVDVRNPYALLWYNWIGKREDWWRKITAGGVYNYYGDHGGNLVESTLRYLFKCEGTLQSYVYFDGYKSRIAYNGSEFDLDYFSIRSNFRPTPDLYLGFNTYFGDRIDYANTRPGKRLRLAPEASYAFGRNLRLSADYIFERMSVEGERLYTAHIGQLSAVYQFSTRAFFRSILQYLDYNYNAENYTFPINPEYKTFFTQLLFSYKINPRTVLFLGYADDYLGSRDFGLTQTGRTFFIKLGYAWML